jgi:hypothetical protein
LRPTLSVSSASIGRGGVGFGIRRSFSRAAAQKALLDLWCDSANRTRVSPSKPPRAAPKPICSISWPLLSQSASPIMHGAQIPVSPAPPLILSRVAPIAASTLSVAKAERPQRKQFGFISLPRILSQSDLPHRSLDLFMAGSGTVAAGCFGPSMIKRTYGSQSADHSCLGVARIHDQLAKLFPKTRRVSDNETA